MDIDADIPPVRTDPPSKVRNHRSGSASNIENEAAGANEPKSVDPVPHLACRALEEMDGTGLAPQPERRKPLPPRRPAKKGVRRSEQPETGRSKVPGELKRGGGKGSSEGGHA